MLRSAHILLLAAALAVTPPGSHRATAGEPSAPPASRGSVVFYHPDGMGAQAWAALRMVQVGPDGDIAWDGLPGMALYRGHMKDALTGTSHGGATVHAYGVKVAADSLGQDGRERVASASGFAGSILAEARARGVRTGIVNTATITDGGTASFAASVASRSMHAEVASQMVAGGHDVLLGGGEMFFLPKGTAGRHASSGAREDGRNLVEEARKAGYAVVYSLGELRALPAETPKVLGLFAADDTFNATSEEELRAAGAPYYIPGVPSTAEMTAEALRFLGHGGRQYLLISEEEGTDNYGNSNNARGMLEAARRADEAIAMLRAHVAAHPSTLVLVASDSDAGGPQVIGPRPGDWAEGKPLPPKDRNGAPLDGIDGTATPPFMSAPDRAGARWPFALAWSTLADTSGAILVRADGLHADRVRGNMDSTGLFALMHATLFGPEGAKAAPAKP